MIDFTNCIEEINEYKGSEKKKTLIYNNKKFLVKFPDPIRSKGKEISYVNNAFSEYIGSQIFSIIGIETQNTLLGYYTVNNTKKTVCACEDFTTSNTYLYEFENIVNSSMLDKKVGTELSDILQVIKQNENIINYNDTINKFWEMFVVDAFIGNGDRHNANWGFIKNISTKEIKFSPIYDCGSCLNPLLSDDEIENLTDAEFGNLMQNSYSCLKVNGKKINSLQYISKKCNQDCNNATKRIVKNIDMNKIINMIKNLDCINSSRKEFYIKILKERYDKFLYPTYLSLVK